MWEYDLILHVELDDVYLISGSVPPHEFRKLPSSDCKALDKAVSHASNGKVEVWDHDFILHVELNDVYQVSKISPTTWIPQAALI